MDVSQPMNVTMQEIVKICNESTTYKQFILNLIVIIVSCKILHLILRYFDQPRIVSEFLVGLLSANIHPFSLSAQVLRPFKELEFFTSAAYMFVLGLEMEPMSILNSPGPEAVIAYAGTVATIVVTVVAYVLFHLGGVHTVTRQEPRLLAVFTLMFAATSSPIVTRLTTELKLGKSEIGRRAIRASLANDMVCTLLMCFLFVFCGRDGTATVEEVVIIICYLVGETAVILLVVRPVLLWVNSRNPEGQRMNAVHMVATVVLILLLCYVSHWFGYDTRVNSFLVGLALPREGRVSNILISKINYVLTTLILPLYFSMANLKLNPMMWADNVDERDKSGVKTSWLNLVYIVVIATVGKLSGTFATGKYFGLHWLEAVTLAVLLNVKGYLQVFFTFNSKMNGWIRENLTIVMVFTVMASIIVAPLIVPFIVRRVRSKGTSSLQLRGLQWYVPTTELRVMVGLHGPQNVPAAANMVEMLRGGTTAGLEVSTVDMIKLTERAATSLVYRQGTDEVMVADDKVVQLGEQIRAALDVYMAAAAATGVVEEGGGAREAGLKLKRILAISSFHNMHEDICCGAQDNMVVLVVLPFHKAQRVDGGMDAGDPGFRTVNQNVLQRASCSVGILVDRGIGRTNNMLSNASLNVATVFTGGADGREALGYAACIARHPGIRLMVVRFLPDKEAIAMAAGPGRRILTAVTDEDKKMKVDDDYFAGFYEQHIANKGVGYMEKHVINGVEAVETLRQLEGSYQLFIVGKGREQDSMLTAGMTERAECPELGPIGDILASSDFSVTASVLVIQQYDTSKDSKLLGDEFLPL